MGGEAEVRGCCRTLCRGPFHLRCWPDIYLPPWSRSGSANLSCVAGVCFSRSPCVPSNQPKRYFPSILCSRGEQRTRLLGAGGEAGVSTGDLSLRALEASKDAEDSQRPGVGVGGSHLAHPTRLQALLVGPARDFQALEGPKSITFIMKQGQVGLCDLEQVFWPLVEGLTVTSQIDLKI